MSIANATEDGILQLIFNATNWGGYADNTATTPQTQVAVALHTADPGEAGDQTTSEAAYTSYARVNVNRTSGGWTVTTGGAGSVSPAANIDFPTGTGGTGTINFFSTGKTGGGTTAILWSGAVSPTIASGSGVLPRLTTSTTITLD